MKEIFKIIEDDYELILFREKGNFLYAKRKNGKLSFSLSEEEIKLLKQVLIKLLPSKNLLALGKLKFLGKNYEYYYDFSNGRYHFFLENTNKLPELKDYIALNKFLNKKFSYIALEEDIKEIEIEEDDDEEIEENSRMETLVKIGKRMITVLIVLNSLFTLDIALLKFGPEKYRAYDYLAKAKIANLFSELDDKFFSKPLTFSEIEEAIQENPNLTSEEKEFYLSDKSFLESQLPYINREDYLDTLKKIYIVYNSGSNGYVEGCYHHTGPDKYGIEIYNAGSFQETEKFKLSHENGHTVSDKEALMDDDTQIFFPFYEILNRQIKNEYKSVGQLRSEGFDSSYDWLESYFNRMARLFSEETLRKFHAVPYAKYLIEELLEIKPDIDLAYDLFHNLYFYDSAYKALLGDYRYAPLQSREEWVDTYNEVVGNLTSILKQYYEVKFKNSIESGDDLEILYLYDREKALAIIKEGDERFKDMSLKEMTKRTSITSWPYYFNKENPHTLNIAISLPNEKGYVSINLTNYKKNFAEGAKK